MDSLPHLHYFIIARLSLLRSPRWMNHSMTWALCCIPRREATAPNYLFVAGNLRGGTQQLGLATSRWWTSYSASLIPFSFASRVPRGGWGPSFLDHLAFQLELYKTPELCKTPPSSNKDITATLRQEDRSIFWRQQCHTLLPGLGLGCSPNIWAIRV